MAKLKLVKKDDSHQISKLSFRFRATSALGISIVADLLDYIAAPVFDMPLLGDIFDVITMSLLFRITQSKVSTAINTIEFIPFVGDMIPVYTFSTILWIIREWRKQLQQKESNVLDYDDGLFQPRT
ncbi:MAG: hypothetical protein WA395_11985 [Nitrososphaeraceae archaeon]|jgi:hypothetical protein